MQKPSVGRVVHYNRPEVGIEPAVTAAAMVTAVDEDAKTVSLTVFAPGCNPEAVADVPYGAVVGGWVWPERV